MNVHCVAKIIFPHNGVKHCSQHMTQRRAQYVVHSGFGAASVNRGTDLMPQLGMDYSAKLQPSSCSLSKLLGVITTVKKGLTYIPYGTGLSPFFHHQPFAPSHSIFNVPLAFLLSCSLRMHLRLPF